jgi:hypothetical protein
MKSLKLFTALALLLVGFSACRETAEVNIVEDKPSNDMIEITTLSGEISVSLGDKISYTGSVHGSVGTEKKCWSKNQVILKLIDTKFNYNKPLVDGETGGDSAKETYIFEALIEGTTEVVIQEWFRGDMENEYLVKVHVTK